MVPLPIATIGLSLAAAGLKVYGGEGAVIELFKHPLDLLAGHRAAADFERVAERFKEWAAGNKPPENEDLERAVTRSAILADLFCLSEAIPTELAWSETVQRLRERLRKLLPQSPVQGLFSQADESGVRAAIAACETRLKDIDRGQFDRAGIDPMRLVLPARGGDYGAELALGALADIEREHQTMPERVQTTFKKRWFGYLCLAFQEQIKADDRVRRIFMLMQIATGFLTVEEATEAMRELEQVVREEAARGRQESRGQHEETRRLVGELKGQLDELATGAEIAAVAQKTAPAQAEDELKRIATLARNEARTAEHPDLCIMGFLDTRIDELTEERVKPTAAELCNKLGLHPYYLSRILDTLQERGLIIKVPSEEDAGQILLSLTRQGHPFAPLDSREACIAKLVVELLEGAMTEFSYNLDERPTADPVEVFLDTVKEFVQKHRGR